MKTIRTNEFLSPAIWDKLVQSRTNNPRVYQGHVINPGNVLDKKNKTKAPINEYAKIIYSQSGEEGIVEYIFDKIGFTNKECIDLGAHNGKWLSNTLYFKEQFNFHRTLVEGNVAVDNITDEETIYEIITVENINELLKDCPDVCDYISIDFDGDDYWVWKEMRPKGRVMVLEYHTALPNDIPLVIMPGQGGMYSIVENNAIFNEELDGYFLGNLRAFYQLAEKLGYKFVTTISVNAIFVMEKEFEKLEIPYISLDECLERYMCLMACWYVDGDKKNREWVIPDED